MKKQRLHGKTIKKIAVSILLVFALVVQFAFLSYLFKAISPNNDKSNVIMDYTSSGNLDYKVYLKQNDFIDSTYLNAGEAYVLDLIDHIKIISLYDFKSTNKTSVTGTNKLISKLKVYYKESTDKSSNPEVMTKQKTLDEKVMSFNDNKFISSGEYDLYLDEYINIIKEFQNKVKIAVDGYLEVSEVNSFSGKVGGAYYGDTYSNTIKIPLSSSVVKIESDASNPKTKSVYESDLVKTNKIVLNYIVIANIVTFIIICFLLRKLFTFTNKTEYERELNKILKNYDDIIVNTRTMVDVSDYKLIKIEDFKEILNLSRELLLPIMNYEIEKGKATCFYVIKDDILYTYLIYDKNAEEYKNKIYKEGY